jgi:hypothetical protein
MQQKEERTKKCAENRTQQTSVHVTKSTISITSAVPLLFSERLDKHAVLEVTQDDNRFTRIMLMVTTEKQVLGPRGHDQEWPFSDWILPTASNLHAYRDL